MTGTTTTPEGRGPQVARTVVAAAAAAVAAVAAGALVATGALASAVEPLPTRTWNAMEHEARRSLAEAQQQQQRVLNPREHEAHRPSPVGPAGRAVITGTCAELLGRAWVDLGHFSDGMETWMLTTPACSPR